jgi:Sulfotransferase family
MQITPHNPGPEAVRDPVFVICNGRSGSTLLRFILDAHPELACPPETNLAALCAHLATVWSLIEGAPLSAERGDEPPEIPETAVAGIRHTMDLMVGSYLRRRGKQRYCDKSLATARYVSLLLRVYPQVRFLCLYRHPMDVIASGIEACPWGLAGFGFDPYIAETPGNAVLALARYWADSAETILGIEGQFPAHCHRVRYEDLVADPERTAAEIFAFVGVSPAPGVSSRCFTGERERFGAADYKIWRTSEITDGSVGRGWSVPAAMIAPPVLATVNNLAGKLGYLPIDDGWGTTAPPGDLRVVSAGADRPEPGQAHRAEGAIRTAVPRLTGVRGTRAAAGPCSELLGEQLRAGLAAANADLTARWGPHAAESFVAVAASSRPSPYTDYWHVNLEARTVTLSDENAQDKSDWNIVGAEDAWSRVIGRDLNLNVALRSCQLRYCDENDDGPVVTETRLTILACLLGIGAW